MNYLVRFADGESALRWPLAIGGPARFDMHSGHTRWQLELPDTPAGHIIVPSFAHIASEPMAFQFKLAAKTTERALLPVPSTEGTRPDKQGDSTLISTHIDCFHSESYLDAPMLTLECAEMPERYLLTVSIRPLQANPDLSVIDVHTNAPRTLSQMEGQDTRVRGSTCSPTSVAMLLDALDRDEIVAACRDNATGMYGSWPLAIRQFARAGKLGSVEVSHSWSSGLVSLRHGQPFVASIRFGPGELPGAPLEKTAGHLVVVTGVAGNRVSVLDPAADSAAEVPRDYDLQAFSNAWLRHRGARYIIEP